MTKGFVYWIHKKGDLDRSEGYIGITTNYIKRWDKHKSDIRLNKHCNPILTRAVTKTNS